MLTCWNTLVELQPETFDDTVRDAETEVRVNTQGDTLALVTAKTLRNTLGNIKAEAQVNALAWTLLNVETRHLATHWAMAKPKHWPTVHLCRGQGSGRLGGRHSSVCAGRDTSLHTKPCRGYLSTFLVTQ